MGFKMNKPNMSISYGGESAKQQKSNLMKDNPVAKHASAMQMKQPGYMSADQANELPPELVKAISKKEKAEGKTQPLNNRKVKKAVRKYKKYKKTKAQIEDLEKKGEYSSWRDKGTKKAKRKVKKASKKFDKMRETSSKLSASEKKEALNKVKKESPASMIEEPEKNKLTKEQQEYLDRTNTAMKKRKAAGKGHTHTSPKGGVPPTKMYKKH